MKISKRLALDNDIEFARSIHHSAYRDVVERQFGLWDEKAQDNFFSGDWTSGVFEIVLCNGIACGYVSIEDRGVEIHVREIVIQPNHQKQGIGTHILREVIEEAKGRKIPVRLGTFHANQAINLYRRLGFQEYERTEKHVMMEWKVENE